MARTRITLVWPDGSRHYVERSGHLTDIATRRRLAAEVALKAGAQVSDWLLLG